MVSLVESLAFDIYCIDVDYIRPRLACSYLVTHNTKAAFIDCGTTHSVPQLLAALDSCNIAHENVEYIIPTHIHLDHAGGAGALMQKLSNAKLLVHPKGAPHLIDPQRLIESASQVYGQKQFDSLYGEIIPVDEARVISAEDNSQVNINGRVLNIAHTPGHARHHFCVYDELSKGWFTGDTFGLSYPDISTDSTHYIMPTTTPVQFEPKAWQESITRLLEKNPQRMYLTHFGVVENIETLAKKLSTDLREYVELASSLRHESDRIDKLKNKLKKYTLNDLQNHGCKQKEDILLKLLETDISLNAQGLDIWLTRIEKST